MKQDKIITYVLAIVFVILIFLMFFLPVKNFELYLLSFVIIYTIICFTFLKIKKIGNISKNRVIILTLILSITYVIILYMIGIFVGFYENQFELTITRFFTRIVTYIILIISTELIRLMLFSKNNRKAIILTTIGFIFIDVIIYIKNHSIWNLAEILELVGYIFIPAISTNLLCNYIVKRYGIIPNIIYRFIIGIYIYIFPILPNVYIFFESIYKIVYPYIIYLILDSTFEIDTFKQAIKYKKLSILGLIISIIVIVLTVMLISCRFKYGVLVTGSSSMAPNIEKGDVVFFEKYEGQTLEEEQVIIFIMDDTRMIHRINKRQIKNNQTIYYTKGDNNENSDSGYRTDEDIIGIVKFRIVDIGWPTLWVNSLFEK